MAAHGSFGGPEGLNGAVGASYAWHNIETSRSVAIPGLAQTLLSDHDATTLQLFGELGYGLALGQISVEPLAQMAHVTTDSEAFIETGGLAALSVADSDQATTFLSPGARVTVADVAAAFRPFASAMWNRAFGDRGGRFEFQLRNRSDLRHQGAAISRHSVELELGVDYRLDGWIIGAAYSGTIADSRDLHAARAIARINF